MSDGFEWDEDKDRANRAKHGVGFGLAARAFADPRRVIFSDVAHGGTEPRFFCLGLVDAGVVTVRFTMRGGVVRIFGAGFWRKGRKVYEHENRRLHR